MQTCSGNLHVDDGFAGREISANQERIFALDRDIELAIAQRWLRKGKSGRGGRWLVARRRPAGQSDRDNVDVFEEAAVCGQDLTFHVRGPDGPVDPQVSIDSRGQVII